PAALGAEVPALSRTLRKESAALALGAKRMLATGEEDFFRNHNGEFDLILNTISGDIPVDRYLHLLLPRGVMAVVGLPPEKQKLSFGSVIGGRSEEHSSELQSRFDLVCRL